MTTIRPNLPPSQPAGAGANSVASARAAFFQAMGAVSQPAPVTPAAPPTPTISAAAAPAQTPITPSEPPARSLRPGSLLDIRV